MQTIITYYKNLTRWDVGYFLHSVNLETAFEAVKLSKVLKDITNERKTILRDDKTYQEPTISSKSNLISVRKTGLGKDFKVKKRTIILTNDLVIACLHTQNGLFAFSTEKFAATSTFIPFSFNKELILKDFLFICLKRYLSNLFKSDSVGRETYTAEEILSLEIPLPPLKIQEKIICNWRKAQKSAQELNRKADEKEKAIDDFILRELGIEKREYKKKKGAFMVWFKELERWGINFNSYNWNLDNLFESKKYKTERVNRVAIINKTYQFSKEDLQKEVSFVPMESVSDIEGEIKTLENKKLDDIKNGFTRFAEGDIIFAKITPCMENGKYAIAKNLTNGIGIGSTEFHVLSPNNNLIDTKYLWTLLRLKTFRKSAERFFVGSAGQQRVPVNFLEEIKIPLPPIKTQKEIAKKVEKMRKEISQTRDRVETILGTAKIKIGKMLKA